MVNFRRWLAALGLVCFAGMWTYAATWNRGFMLLCAIVFAAGDALAAVALMRRWFWARWLGLGIGLVGTMNIAVWLGLRGLVLDPPMLAQGIAFPSLFLLLLGDGMRRVFDLQPSPYNHWRLESWPVRLLQWAVVLNIATAPMLLSYACLDGTAPAHRLVTFAIAGVLAAGVLLVVLQRSAGLLLMMAAGVGTVVLGIDALPRLLGACGDEYQFLLVVTAVAAFPAGVLGALASTVVFARPIIRFLRAPE